MRARKVIYIMIAAAAVNLITMGGLVMNLPPEIPVHFNIHFEVDRMGSRLFLLVLPALALMMPCVVLAEKSIRKNNNAEKKALTVFTGCFVSLFIALDWMLYSMSAMGAQMGDKVKTPLELAVFMGLSVMFVVLGNYMPALTPNHAFRGRLKSTIAKEECWRRTHHFSGHMYVLAGVLSGVLVLVGFFRNWVWLEAVGFLGCMAGANLLTLYYAVRVAKRLEKEDEAEKMLPRS